jgi:lysophospholipase L1-like esterase
MKQNPSIITSTVLILITSATLHCTADDSNTITNSGAGDIVGPPLQRLLFSGDSITYGVGVTGGGQNRYSTRVTQMLKRYYPEIKEINDGQSGRALCQQGDDYAENLLAQKPDAVVIQWGVNDDYWGFSIAQFSEKYERLVVALRQARPRMPIVLTTLVPDFRHGGSLDTWSSEADVRIQEIAVRYQCQLADVHRVLDHRRKDYQADEVHPNNLGAEKMAAAIVSAFLAPPATETNVGFTFDMGRDVRFMQYIFMPQRQDEQPHWTEISEFNPATGDMKIRTELPLEIIFPKRYGAMVVVEDATGDIMSQTPISNWKREFTVTPGNHPQPLVIKVKD